MLLSHDVCSTSILSKNKEDFEEQDPKGRERKTGSNIELKEEAKARLLYKSVGHVG